MNQLEEYLQLAATDPGYRPKFYQAVLESVVYVLGESDTAPAEGEQVALQPGARVALQHWQKEDGTAVVPFFSSLEILKASVEGDQRYVSLPGRDLFGLMDGVNFALNPRSEHGKEFLPQEIEKLLKGELFDREAVPQAREVMLGRPDESPAALIAALQSLFSTLPQVTAAYLAMMHDPKADEQEHFLIGIDCPDFGTVMQQAGIVVKETSEITEPVDFVDIQTDRSGLGSYLVEKTNPIYQRAED